MQFGSCHFSASNLQWDPISHQEKSQRPCTPAAPLHTHISLTEVSTLALAYYCIPTRWSSWNSWNKPSTLQLKTLPSLFPAYRIFFPPTLTRFFYLLQISACAVLCLLSRVQLSETPWTVARQAPLSMGLLQAGTLEWAAMPCSFGRSSQPRD